MLKLCIRGQMKTTGNQHAWGHLHDLSQCETTGKKKPNTFSVKFKNPPQFHSIIFPLERKELNKRRFNMRWTSCSGSAAQNCWGSEITRRLGRKQREMFLATSPFTRALAAQYCARQNRHATRANRTTDAFMFFTARSKKMTPRITCKRSMTKITRNPYRSPSSVILAVVV